MENKPMTCFMYRGDVVVVTDMGHLMIWCMHPVTGEYAWYNIGSIRHPFP